MLKFAANLSMLFTEQPFLDRFQAAANAGFAGVEYLFPYAYPADELAAQLAQHQLSQVLFNLPPGNWGAGERGITCHPGREPEFREGVAQALHYARKLGCPRLNCLAGLHPQGVTEREAFTTLVNNLQYAADCLESDGRILTVEAINSRVDMPGFFLDTSAKAISAIKAAGRPNIRLQYDLYHMQIMEGDLCRSLSRLLPSIGHIQFADNPGRHEPGTGEINFEAVFRHLDAEGYDGWISAEYRPSRDTAESLSWMKWGIVDHAPVGNC